MTGFQQVNSDRRVRADPVGRNTTRRTSANYDVICYFIHKELPPDRIRVADGNGFPVLQLPQPACSASGLNLTFDTSPKWSLFQTSNPKNPIDRRF
jgi:hypothetical protein